MRALLSLILLIGAAIMVDQFVAHFGEAFEPQIMRTAMNVGLLMLGAWLTGLLFEKIHLPRISGYLVFGVLVGPQFWPQIMQGLGLADHAIANPLIESDELPLMAFASDLAIALIAVTAGGEIRLSWLRKELRPVSLITGIELLTVWSVVGVAVFIAQSYVPLIDDASLTSRIVLSALTGLVAATNSPAVVIAMITEYRATGVLARTTLAVTIFKDMLMVVLFAASLAIGKGLVDENTSISPAFLIVVSAQLVGSLALGAIIGMAMAWYVHKVRQHLVFVVLGSCMLLAMLGEQVFEVGGQLMHFEPLLMGLTAGLVMRNAWPKETEPLFESVERMSLPVYCLFFALAGAKLDLHVLLQLWIVVLVLVAVRTAALCGSVTLASRLAKLPTEVRGKMWMGFVPQAGISLALASLISKAFPADANIQVDSVLIGMVAIHELLGPIGFRYALLRSGETRKD